jgi:hypothetical protein
MFLVLQLEVVVGQSLLWGAFCTVRAAGKTIR